MIKMLETMKAFFERHPILPEAVAIVKEIDSLLADANGVTSDDVAAMLSDGQATVAQMVKDIADLKADAVSITDALATVAVLRGDIADLKKLIADVKANQDAAKVPPVVTPAPVVVQG